MYAKVFAQIFDSSIADDFRLRHFFMDLLVLADRNGVVDMTPTAIAARTRMPLDDVKSLLAKLEQPDPESRTPDHDGQRIAKLDDHRTWGWHIINYSRFREIASEEQRREKTRARVAGFRQKRQQKPACNAPVTQGNACNAMQRQKQMQMQMQKEEEGATAPAPSNGKRSKPPCLEEVKLAAAKIGLPDSEAEKFWNYYESNGWIVGKAPMRSWPHALANWKSRWQPAPKKQQPPQGERKF